MSHPRFLAQQWSLVLGDHSHAAPTDADVEPLPELQLAQDGKFDELLTSLWIRRILGSDIADSMRPEVRTLKETVDYARFLEAQLAKWITQVPDHDGDRTVCLLWLMTIGVAALESFIQSNVTGPPLSFAPEKILLPQATMANEELFKRFARASIPALTVDGENAYHLMPNSMLLVLAKTVLNFPPLIEDRNAPETARWWRMRANFVHQRVLSNPTGTLHNLVYEDLEALPSVVMPQGKIAHAKLLVEKATVDSYFGYDERARKGLETAARLTGMKFALTGIMGKRTKFQQHDTSQLVVLARSAQETGSGEAGKPQALDLNDDTLLESISFSEKTVNDTTVILDESTLPSELASLDPNAQPPLHPLDGTILLLLTDTIKNTNAETGITREEMLPYAERVLTHSTNWQVYTHALMVRSKLEAYRSRTIERGVLQLQAVVDQVIAETTVPKKDDADGESPSNGATTFLPRAKESEAAPIQERLRYVHQLSAPTRWELESELASKWAHLGALRTALEIYERLEMWPEVALCWAATEREDKARELIRSQLFEDAGSAEPKERDPPPLDAPRMWCILGDMDKDIGCYERAWEVSGKRYARAQRSIGLHHLAQKDYQKAAAAYTTSLRVNPLNARSWFALGCCWLELEHYSGAVEAFGRVVAIDEDDGEAWSNLAAALLRRETAAEVPSKQPRLDDEEEDNEMEIGPADGAGGMVVDVEKNKRDALQALKRACQFKRDSWKIWENYLIVAASINPPAYQDVLLATKHLIELRKDSAGETALDADILEMLVQHVISTTDTYDPNSPGLPRQVVQLVEKDVVPLITTDARLWKLVGRMQLWRKRPKSALEAQEKAWRAVNSRPGITDASEKEWDELVEATTELADAYESLGQMESTEGMSSGEPVAKDWRFKARSAVRSVMGKGKANWEDTKGWDRLVETLEGIKL